MNSAKFPKRNYAPRPRKESRAERPPERRNAGPPERRGERGGERRGARGERAPERRELRGERRPPFAATAQPPAPIPAAPAAETAWEPQAQWYDQLQGDGGDDFYHQLILPAVLRQLAAKAGERVLDVGCGQGVLGRALALKGVASVGVDASPTLIQAAKARAKTIERYLVGDACRLAEAVPGERFDHAALVMALQDLDPIQPVLAGIAAALKPGGRLVIAMTHPVLRIPRRTTWGFDEDNGVQFRRLDGYLSPMRLPIRTHPGRVQDTSSTTTFHRPLSTYLNAIGAAGLGVVACDELCSHRRGTKGPRFGAEDRAAKEFPVFLILTAVRL